MCFYVYILQTPILKDFEIMNTNGTNFQTCGDRDSGIPCSVGRSGGGRYSCKSICSEGVGGTASRTRRPPRSSIWGGGKVH